MFLTLGAKINYIFCQCSSPLLKRVSLILV